MWDVYKEKEEHVANRIAQQKLNNDYDDDMEQCDDCGSYLNSHGHCPRCDY